MGDSRRTVNTQCSYVLAFVKLWMKFSISMYMMCLILHLFSTLSHWLGALQISIVIIIKIIFVVCLTGHENCHDGS